MKELPEITLVLADTKNYGQAAFSLKKSLEQIKPARTIFFTDIVVDLGPDIEVIQIGALNSKEDYSRFIVKELNQYINTSYVLVTQWDGYVLSGDAWSNEFFKYDYIGAPWLYTDGRNCGNGGFSLRSKRLQHFLSFEASIEMVHPEDEVTCRLYRSYLERWEFKFAPDEVGDRFSYELREPICQTFGFHGHHHQRYRETVIIKRSGALGDVVMVEPVLDYFHKKGYRVALDTNPVCFDLFSQHHFRVFRREELDGRVPVKEFNLDMSYESKPDKLHLQSYYDFCGITDGEIRNPRLHIDFQITKGSKLFKKYALIHADNRPEPHRNIYNFDWGKAVNVLLSLGYTVFQVGTGDIVIPGAIQFRTPGTVFLMGVVAGADLFLGIDSGISHIASAFNIPSIIFFGSVKPAVIHPTSINKEYIHRHFNNIRGSVCDKPFCWSGALSTNGQDCYVDKEHPPCTQFTNQLSHVIDAIHEFDTYII